MGKGGFPLSRTSKCEYVNFTRFSKIETMYERSRVNVKVDLAQLSRFLVTFHTLPPFRRANFTCTEKLRKDPHPPPPPHSSCPRLSHRMFMRPSLRKE